MAHQLRTLVPLVTLPDGSRIENSGTTVTVSDDVWAKIPASAIGVDITDLGAVIAGDAVTVQGTHVTAPAALTSAQASALTSSQNGALTSSQNATTAAVDLATSEALANALKANYNQLQTDVVALRASYNQAQVDIAALRTAYNAAQVDIAALQSKLTAEIAALEVSGGPQS